MNVGMSLGILILVTCAACAVAILLWMSIRRRDSQGRSTREGRVRRCGTLLIGGGLLGFAIALAVGLMSGVVDWMRLAPVSGLELCLASKNAETATDALHEVERRLRARSYLLEDAWPLIDACLARRRPAGITQVSLNQLGVQERDLQELLGSFLCTAYGKWMSTQQRELFLQSLVEMKMYVTPSTPVGDEVQYSLHCAGTTLLPESWWIRLDYGEQRVDGEIVGLGSGCTSGHLSSISWSRQYSVPAEAGKHVLEVQVKGELWVGCAVDEDVSNLVGQYEVVLRSEFEVVRSQDEDPSE